MRRQNGTFVASHDDPRSHYRFLRLIPDDGSMVESHSEPFACAVQEAAPEVAAALQPGNQGARHRDQALASFAGKSVIYDQIYPPASSRG